MPRTLQQLGAELRQLREWRELTLTEAAQRAGISKALLTLAEQGKRRLPLEALQRLLRLYGSSLTQLMSASCTALRAAPGTERWQGTDLLSLVSDRSLRGCTLRLLRPVFSSQQPVWLELRLAPGAQLPPGEYWSLPTLTEGIALEGNLLVELPGDELLVRSGESFAIHAERQHRYRNYLPVPIRAVLVLTSAVL